MKEEDKDNFSTVPGKIQSPLRLTYESNPLLGVLSISYFLLTERCKALKNRKTAMSQLLWLKVENMEEKREKNMLLAFQHQNTLANGWISILP